MPRVRGHDDYLTFAAVTKGFKFYIWCHDQGFKVLQIETQENAKGSLFLTEIVWKTIYMAGLI